jgi:hypothetical protein
MPKQQPYANKQVNNTPIYVNSGTTQQTPISNPVYAQQNPVQVNNQVYNNPQQPVHSVPMYAHQNPPPTYSNAVNQPACNPHV